jgi:hypothetical protein
LQQGFEQSPEDHRIGDVVDMKFVQTQQPGGTLDAVGQGQQGIALMREPFHLVMHLDHELVEMDAAFAPVRQAVIEAVHEKGLAAPHSAPDIQALGHVWTEQAAP